MYVFSRMQYACMHVEPTYLILIFLLFFAVKVFRIDGNECNPSLG